MPPPRDAVDLRGFLSEREVPCPGCGYNLRGLATDRCPECNQPLALMVGLAEPKMRLWLATVVGLALGVGLNSLLLVYAVLVNRAGNLLWHAFGAHNAVGLLVEGSLLGAVLLGGRSIRRWGLVPRWLACAGAFVLTLVNIAVFARLIN